MPRERGLKPSYDQKRLPAEAEHASRLGPGQGVDPALAPDRHASVQVARGSVDFNGTRLSEGDGAAISAEMSLSFRGVNGADFLVFDLN